MVLNVQSDNLIEEVRSAICMEQAFIFLGPYVRPLVTVLGIHSRPLVRHAVESKVGFYLPLSYRV